MLNLQEAQELHYRIGLALETGAVAQLVYARELASIVVSDAQECEFEQVNPHEWYCTTHEVTKIASTKEPVTCG